MRIPTWLPLLLVAAVCPARAGDWPQLLGPARDGRAAADERFPDTLAAAGPRRVWQRKAGPGYGGVVVAGGRAFLFHRVASAERLEALDAATGALLWSLDHPTTFAPQVGGNTGPLCTPVVAGDRVVTFGAQGVLTCADAVSGKRLWEVDTQRTFSAQEGYFGAGSTPLVIGDRVVVNVGGTRREAGIVAFALADGAVAWSKTAEPASYAAPVAATVAEKPHVVIVTRYKCLLLDPVDGAIRWEFPFGQRGPTVNAAVPVILPGNLLLVTASYGIGSVGARFDGDGLARVWDGIDGLASQYCTPVAVGDHVYAFDGREDGPPGALVCLDPATGQRAWSVPDVGYGHVIAAGDKVLAVTNGGELILVAADPRGPRVLGRSPALGAAVRAAPALAGGRLYLRNDTEVVALDLAP
jgi:outer membrane protein assembly factor BamB